MTDRRYVPGNGGVTDLSGLSWEPVVGSVKTGMLLEGDAPFSVTVYYLADGRTECVGCSCNDELHYAAVVDVPVGAVACVEVRE
jgi:hypothetical protein